MIGISIIKFNIELSVGSGFWKALSSAVVVVFCFYKLKLNWLRKWVFAFFEGVSLRLKLVLWYCVENVVLYYLLAKTGTNRPVR